MSPDFDRRMDQFVQQASFSQPMSTGRRNGAQNSSDRSAPIPPSPTLGEMTADDYLREVRPDLVRPNFLRSPTDNAQPGIPMEPLGGTTELLDLPMDAPLGFTGPSSVVPSEGQTSSHFVPIEDRWRIGLPEWDRYGLNHPPLDDYPYNLGRKHDPYHQNVLKGDYPIIGQHTFLDVTAANALTSSTAVRCRRRRLPLKARRIRTRPISSATRINSLRPTSTCCRSICSTATRHSNRSIGESKSRRCSTSTIWTCKSWRSLIPTCSTAPPGSAIGGHCKNGSPK